MLLNEDRFQELITRSSFLANINSVAMIGYAQGILKQTDFPLALPSSGIFCLHGFIQSSIDVRQIGFRV
jgi:hypothetical protein